MIDYEKLAKQLRDKYAEVKEAGIAKMRGHDILCPGNGYNWLSPCECGQNKRVDRYAVLWKELETMLEEIP